jgi:hypothetical protein
VDFAPAIPPSGAADTFRRLEWNVTRVTDNALDAFLIRSYPEARLDSKFGSSADSSSMMITGSSLVSDTNSSQAAIGDETEMLMRNLQHDFGASANVTYSIGKMGCDAES